MAASTGYSYIAAGSANQDAQAVKASAGTLYGWSVTNTSGTFLYLKLYNLASGATSAGTPLVRLGVRGGETLSVDLALGVTFGTGISHRITSGVADTDASAAVANSMLVNLWYQ